MTARQHLWDVAIEQYGYITAADAQTLGIPVIELGKMASRNRLHRVSQGLYRFPEWPQSANDPLMEAVLWTLDRRAALSHDTALEVYDLCDINPANTHVTIPTRTKKLRRKHTPASLIVHYQDLTDNQIGWWEGIPTVTVSTAIDQCITTHVRPDIITKAINTARDQGRIDIDTATRQLQRLKDGHT